MRFLIDENICQEAIQFLEEKGHDAKRTPKGLSNGDVLQLAQEENRILLTHDKDFVNVTLYPPKSILGIVLLKIHPPNVPNVLSVLGKLLSQHTSPESLRGKCTIMEKM